MVSMALVKRYPVAVFFGASVSIGWIVTIAAARLPGASALLPLVAIPVSYVPAAAALVVLRVAGSEDDKQALRRRLTTVRVDSRERSAESFRCEQRLHGVLVRQDRFALRPGRSILLPVTQAGPGPVEILLFRGTDASTYRRLIL